MSLIFNFLCVYWHITHCCGFGNHNITPFLVWCQPECVRSLHWHLATSGTDSRDRCQSVWHMIEWQSLGESVLLTRPVFNVANWTAGLWLMKDHTPLTGRRSHTDALCQHTTLRGMEREKHLMDSTH